jgi:hypothetical protein
VEVHFFPATDRDDGFTPKEFLFQQLSTDSSGLGLAAIIAKCLTSSNICPENFKTDNINFCLSAYIHRSYKQMNLMLFGIRRKFISIPASSREAL